MKSLLTVFVVGLISVVFAGCCGDGKCPITGLGGDEETKCSLKNNKCSLSGKECADKEKCSMKKDCPVLAKKAVICACGEIKGTANCCKKDAVKCSKCGLNKGSIACCKKDLVGKEICLKCGDIKGTENCCKKDAKKCPKCNLNKGSVGCCDPIIGRMIEGVA